MCCNCVPGGRILASTIRERSPAVPIACLLKQQELLRIPAHLHITFEPRCIP